ncbi:Peptide methionine sulfoxide reductase MsrA [Pelagimonas phthalicica]|uniref:Peptide methionine sulfoxide reductase MsrA n=1 Tax=Pelagimonas phthalicica TaxID=1037362 RepID=A0A238J6A8_9RHOB|nr:MULTISPECIES: peptide-methionine (S)-S-oxide reductase MsrA [Roseobacteraceae]MBO9463820.1 peptide-methionine (S)-S-oxide reductase MsrA [Tropicibacter sp. R15_0]TDS95298.1 peptide-methionine (S)-S-oxide reductase [Pelagimonas phthalicica]SMX26178.1 Peptide methionine sulfoxide reductase MsrA [Pelagimonas phthalicica]
MRMLTRARPIALMLLMSLGFAAQGSDALADEIVVAGGCFWCVESDFESVRGVKGAVSGYTGGHVANPTYKQVTRGGSGHYEAVKITFNASQVSQRQLYDLFFRSVDPTDAGGQFCDRGDSYRTAIFVSNDAQKRDAEAAKKAASAALGRTIVTPILPAGAFFEAEGYHQDYYKGTKRVLTRFGPIKQKDAYKKYRNACGRDQRVKELWGSEAAFAK